MMACFVHRWMRKNEISIACVPWSDCSQKFQRGLIDNPSQPVLWSSGYPLVQLKRHEKSSAAFVVLVMLHAWVFLLSRSDFLDQAFTAMYSLRGGFTNLLYTMETSSLEIVISLRFPFC